MHVEGDPNSSTIIKPCVIKYMHLILVLFNTVVYSGSHGKLRKFYAVQKSSSYWD